MIKKTVTYTDFNGDETTEELHFHLTMAEVMELETSGEGSFAGILKRISETSNPREVLEMYRTMLLTAYGIRSSDGRNFRKSAEIRETFASSNAFSELLFDLMKSEDGGAAFITGIFPKDLMERAEALQAARTDGRPAVEDRKSKSK